MIEEMNEVSELKDRLAHAKKVGYYECQYDYQVLDHEYWFDHQLRSGWELIKIDSAIDSYSDSEGEKFKFLIAKFKFNQAMEDWMNLDIKKAEERERHASQLKALDEEYIKLINRKQQEKINKEETENGRNQ